MSGRGDEELTHVGTRGRGTDACRDDGTTTGRGTDEELTLVISRVPGRLRPLSSRQVSAEVKRENQKRGSLNGAHARRTGLRPGESRCYPAFYCHLRLVVRASFVPT